MPRLFISGLLLLASLAAPACAEDQALPDKAGYTLTDIEMQLEAGAGFFEAWPTGKTIHSGVGYIQPYGEADYWCGVGYDEAKAYADATAQHGWLVENAIDTNPLFCIYRLNSGDIYALDVLVGTIRKTEDGKGRQDSVVNIVLGGTADFEGASGVWVGTTAGRGEVSEVEPGLELPASILKLMDGYVRLPTE